MTTPRDQQAPGWGQGGHSDEPPAFPSVGGPNDSSGRADSAPPFTRSYGPPPAAGWSPPGTASGYAPGGPSPVVPVSATGPAYAVDRNGRWRWVAAGLATVLVLAAVAGVFVFFGSRQAAAPSLVAQYVPANPTAYIEVRLDLPGDQRDRLSSFMSRFPGFADPAAFQQKIDETLASTFRSSGTGIDWEADVKPWFGGMIGVYMTSLDAASREDLAGGLVFSVKDSALVRDLVAARAGGTAASQEEYKGATIWVDMPTPDGEHLSAGVTGDALVVSPKLDDVKAALDAHAGDTQGLADDSYFTGQLSELSADHLGLFYYDYGSLVEAMPTPMPIPSGMPGVMLPECMGELTSAADIRLVGEIRAEDDHMSLRARAEAPRVEGFPQFENKTSTLPATMPASTVAYLEYRGIGQTIKYYITKFMECLPAEQGGQFDPRQIRQMLGTDPEDYLDFLDDVAVGVTLNDGKFGGGVVATVNDENVARARVERLLSALRLAAGMSGSGGITIEEQQHGDATITVINLGDEIGQGEDVPPVSVTVARGRLYVGLGDFVTNSLDQAEADSLAAAPRLQAALNAAGHENAALAYVDIAALRGAVEAMAPNADRTKYETEIKPFVEPLKQFVLVGRNDDGIYESNMFLYVE
jgi:hypothetical protein